ncbi:MAG: rhomboid family intramembrane serine protease [Alphaproteobacteria bacterium]|nr:rhomboid family intramembrane serine protease [Alphaproteobacteria bacterium]
MIPIHDSNYAPGVPYVTWGIIGVCFFVLLGLSEHQQPELFYYTYGVVPEVLLAGATLRPDLHFTPEAFYGVTLATSVFVHGGWAHLIGNMIFLWIFGDNVESATGHGKFLIFFLACGIAASLIHATTALNTESAHLPLVGASGAISGVVGAYLLLWPRAWLWVWVGIPIKLPAFLIIAFWAGIQVTNATNAIGGGVAWWAHVGGFVVGIILIPFVKKPYVPWLSRGVKRDHTTP